jgi:predicted nucleotidyltransferase
MVDSKAIQDFRDQIVEHFKPEKIILFGSYAYGMPSADSDVDILVILTFEGKNAYKSAEILTKTNPRFPVDLITRTPEEVKDRLAKGDFFLKEIINKGRILYEATDARMD